ncbi:hypothetical protein CCACVL1_04395 [Corchorus capsularis]|uniref:Uncharacterized protein n=1 Tax=Corchorus capsularis TaxID=210143 RepID=A0A1R3JSX3_COCAP|nr:hypothetical protein CCACVL1_04395 [Corchorus capsularis]
MASNEFSTWQAQFSKIPGSNQSYKLSKFMKQECRSTSISQ